MMGKKEFEFKGLVDRQRLIDLLQNLVDSLKKGQVCFQRGPEYVVLNLDENQPLEVGISAGEKKGKNKFDLEDLRDQLRSLKKMGPLQSVMEMVPGMGKMMPDEGMGGMGGMPGMM